MKMLMTRAHSLSLEVLRARMEKRVAFYDRKYPGVGLATLYRWSDPDTCVAEYRGGSARMSLSPDSLTVQLELPFFARLYRARIEEFVRRELADVTAPEETADPTPAT